MSLKIVGDNSVIPANLLSIRSLNPDKNIFGTLRPFISTLQAAIQPLTPMVLVLVYCRIWRVRPYIVPNFQYTASNIWHPCHFITDTLTHRSQNGSYINLHEIWPHFVKVLILTVEITQSEKITGL